MCFDELTIEIQAKSEELAHLCMDIGRCEAMLETKKQDKIRRAGELNKLFDELRKTTPEVKKEEKTAEKKQDPAKKPLDMGKVTALRQAGWSAKKIADEVGASEWDIRKALGMK